MVEKSTINIHKGDTKFNLSIKNKSRFHPYYYQNRKAMLYLENENRKKINIKKIIKSLDEIIITIKINKTEKMIELKSNWHNLEFDYYNIQSNINNWLITFSKK